MPDEYKTLYYVTKFKKVHKNKYDYSVTRYIDKHTKINIACPKHGTFEQYVCHHLKGHGCPRCKGGTKFVLEDFVKKAKRTHGNKYDYSKVDYKNQKTEVIIVCPVHGEFKQKPQNHIRGSKCPKCKNDIKRNLKPTKSRRVLSTHQFVDRAKKVHGDKYDYSKVNYKNNKTKVTIVCPIHGEFDQVACYHISGNWCPKCGRESSCNSMLHDSEKFIQKAVKVHGSKYGYSLVNYIKAIKKVTIVCPTHGKFEQIANNHLKGHGCPKCSSSTGEAEIERALDELNIRYSSNYYVNTGNNVYFFDFFLPDYNLFIEYDGRQHFTPIEHFGGEDGFNRTKERDINKNKYCIESNKLLLRIPHTKHDCIKDIIKDVLLDISSKNYHISDDFHMDENNAVLFSAGCSGCAN